MSKNSKTSSSRLAAAITAAASVHRRRNPKPHQPRAPLAPETGCCASHFNPIAGKKERCGKKPYVFIKGLGWVCLEDLCLWCRKNIVDKTNGSKKCFRCASKVVALTAGLTPELLWNMHLVEKGLKYSNHLAAVELRISNRKRKIADKALAILEKRAAAKELAHSIEDIDHRALGILGFDLESGVMNFCVASDDVYDDNDVGSRMVFSNDMDKFDRQISSANTSVQASNMVLNNNYANDMVVRIDPISQLAEDFDEIGGIIPSHVNEFNSSVNDDDID